MTDHVIVTVYSKENEFELDMELPMKMPISELAPGLLENLKVINGQLFRGKEGISLKYRGTELKSTETLETACVFDGSLIEVR